MEILSWLVYRSECQVKCHIHCWNTFMMRTHLSQYAAHDQLLQMVGAMKLSLSPLAWYTSLYELLARGHSHLRYNYGSLLLLKSFCLSSGATICHKSWYCFTAEGCKPFFLICVPYSCKPHHLAWHDRSADHHQGLTSTLCTCKWLHQWRLHIISNHLKH